ncbi:MAG: sensor domain-containing phosphodiesterase [Lachnospiraceae bacterium]|nr:sensor domain-containing phosphodiesterase [Lachnospiraceae bacterium]
MKESSFWEKDGRKIVSIIETFDRLSDNSHIWVTDLKEKQTWCTEKTMNLFGLRSQMVPDFEHVITKFVHPSDREEYLEAIDRRLQGIDLDRELCIRFRTRDGVVAMFSFHMEEVCDDNGIPEYLVVLFNNENEFREIDALTDLYSEYRYVEDLKKAIASGDRFAVLQIHVEGFSTFNLIYGRDFANELLQTIAIKFIYMMDMDKAVYHLERERYAFILKKSGRKELLEFEREVRNVLDDGIMVEGKLHSLKMGAGAILLEDYQGDASSICGQVTYALNHSVRRHQDQLVIFNDEVKTSHGVDFELMKVIHQSVCNGCEGFRLEYQPIVDSGTGHIVGAEALVRWQMEPYGKVPPSMFIEWMETDPSMYELGNYVLRRALLETGEILKYQPDFFINVNISVKQLERLEFRGEVLEILEETGFPADHLCMELTERCKDFPIDLLCEEVQFLHSLNIRVAMDDYGTGSASSHIVMNVPMDEIKIDMSFITDIIGNSKNQAMVQTMVDFANKTGMATCLEGVETEELQNYLREYHATWFQGYYYSKPVSVQGLKGLIEEQSS